MSLNPTYRTWKLEDTPQIQEVLFKTWTVSYSNFIPMMDLQRYFTNHYSEWHFTQLFGDRQVWSYVAEVQGQIIGYARARIKHDENRMYVESLYVLPEFQGQGIGSALLKMVEELALQQSHKTIWLGVMVQNVSSLEWYKKLNFQFVEEAPFHMGDSTVNHLIGYRAIKREHARSSDDQ